MTGETELQKRYETLILEFMDNGFTRQQAAYLINLLNEYIPIV